MSSTAESPATTGRPRSFDRDSVLDALVQLFWENGYESTSMTEIVNATGLNKSSLYNAFGPKDVLFHEALKRYVSLRSDGAEMVLGKGTAGLADIHLLFDLLWQEVNENSNRRGCLAVNSSTELGSRDQQVAVVVLHYRTVMREAFRAALNRAADQGEIAPQNVETYANLAVTSMLGLAVIVRSGASDEEVRSQLDATLHMIDAWKS